MNIKISTRVDNLNLWYGQKIICFVWAYKDSEQSWFIGTSPVIMRGLAEDIENQKTRGYFYPAVTTADILWDLLAESYECLYAVEHGVILIVNIQLHGDITSLF